MNTHFPVDPRSHHIAKTLRNREIRRAKAAEREARKAARARRRLARRERRNEARTPRARVIRRAGERQLVFRGPHTTLDFWLVTGLVLSYILGLLVVLAWFWPLIGLSLIAVLVGGWLAWVYTPMRVTVTDHGYLEIRRFRRRVGRATRLTFRTGRGHGSDAYAFYCSVLVGDDEVLAIPSLSSKDIATVQRFEAELAAPVRPPEHDGAYRVAA